MWIVTKYGCIINSQHVTRFTENNQGTRAYCGSLVYPVSSEPILATIIEALKNHADFMEVE